MNKPYSQDYICHETGEIETLEFTRREQIPASFNSVSELHGKLVHFVQFDDENY